MSWTISFKLEIVNNSFLNSALLYRSDVGSFREIVILTLKWTGVYGGCGKVCEV